MKGRQEFFFTGEHRIESFVVCGKIVSHEQPVRLFLDSCLYCLEKCQQSVAIFFVGASDTYTVIPAS
jgi:hypothetical protein